MCGIWALLQQSPILTEKIITAFNSIKNRGPDSSVMHIDRNYIAGFHRLAINDISVNGNQPFYYSNEEYNYVLMANGEIYNHKILENKYNIKPNSRSDCAVLLPLFIHLNEDFEQLNNELRGEYALLIIKQHKVTNELYYFASTDPLSVRPLFYFVETYDDDVTKQFSIGFSSLLAGLSGLSNNVNRLQQGNMIIGQVDFYNKTAECKIMRYHKIKVNSEIMISNDEDLNSLYKYIVSVLTDAVILRLESDRPIGCLLSGGVDSSIIASILSNIYKKQGKKIKTFSIGFPDSTDLKYAKIVAEHIDSDHHEYIINYEDALKAIPQVIKTIETYDITTIRASTPMYLLCKWIKENFEETVIFSGEGSDELFGGYLYFHNAPDYFEFHRETIKLVSNLHIYDVLRADRCTSGNSLELREPFLDKDLVNYVCNLSGNYKQPFNNYEKYILRKAFKGFLPDNVLWRKKAAFSDAVSGSEKPWFKHIQEYCNTLITDDELILANKNNLNSIKFTKESYWFYKIFKQLFPSYNLKIDFWLPKWCNTTDPSATTIENIYNKKEHQ